MHPAEHYRGQAHFPNRPRKEFNRVDEFPLEYYPTGPEFRASLKGKSFLKLHWRI